MLVTISGEPGSGKTTVARLLAKRLELPHVYAGDLYRREAESRGLTLEAFNCLCERDHSVDRRLDADMAARARRGNVVLEGRLAGFVAAQEGLAALKVWLTASEEVRARRVAQREGRDWREVLGINHHRHGSDAKRYKEIYGFDISDKSLYDIILNTDDQTPEALAEQIEQRARRRFSSSGPQS